LINWGLWSHSESDYDEQLKKIFSTFRKVLDAQNKKPVPQRTKLPLFKETTPQHFYSTQHTGEFEAFLQDSFPACWGSDKLAKAPNFTSGKCDPRLLLPTCVPVMNASNWRNKLLHKLHTKLGLAGAVPIIPVYKYLLPRWDAHNDAALVSGGLQSWRETGPPPQTDHFDAITFRKGGQDCTHYAYTPMLYTPVWREIYDVLKDWLKEIKGEDTSTFVKEQPVTDWH
jgi:hypothetical protein